MSKIKRAIHWVVADNEKYAGVHFLAEFWQGKTTEDPEKLKDILTMAAKKSGHTVLGTTIHKFEPQGITGLVLLAESHISVHSWPEFGYLAIDIFSCGEKGKPQLALDFLKEQFQPKKVEMQIIKRGVIR